MHSVTKLHVNVAETRSQLEKKTSFLADSSLANSEKFRLADDKDKYVVVVVVWVVEKQNKRTLFTVA